MNDHKADISPKMKSEERFRALIEHSTEAIWCIELERPLAIDLPEDKQIDHLYQYAYFTEANDLYARSAGYERGEEMVGLRLEDVMPRSMPESIATLRQLIRTGYSMTDLESVEVTKDGALYYFLKNISPIVEEGRLLRTWGTSRDITTLKTVVENLRQAQRIAHLGSWDWDITRNELWWSDEVYRIFGRSSKSFGATYEAFLDTVHPNDRDQVARTVDLALQSTENTYSIEHRIVLPNGDERVVHERAEVTFDNGGKPVRMIGTVQDITERRKMERALIQSKEFNSAVLNSIGDHIAVLDQTGCILAVNDSWMNFARENKANMELIGTGVNYIDVCRQASSAESTVDRQSVHAAVEGLDSVLNGSSARFSMEYPCHASTQQRWFQMVVLPFKGAKGGVVVAHRDITARKESEIRTRQANREIARLQKRLEKEWLYLQEEIKGEHNFDNIIGNSDALKYVLYRVAEVAPTNAPVLIMGETGTGKELIARAIHNASTRSKRALVKINCAALPATLVESELFGYEKGAFTGADTRRVGRFQLADGATLFLDEISEIPIELQAKLLRVLQDGELEPLGSSKTMRVDVRIIAASNRNLDEAVKNRRFRKDLLYRINVFPLTIAPLRHRKEDIPLLVNWFVKKYNREMGKTIISIPGSVIEHLQSYDWPGNVRELENVIERAVIASKNSVFKLTEKLTPSGRTGTWGNRSQRLADVEREHISDILEKTRWKIEGRQGAAQVLGLAPSTLRDRMKKLGIRRSTPRS
ncbi:MAG: sigma 54-interacting transcriptional regulator [Desulfobacteraceae bacterium]